jgi:riboflavin kinase / FMN adenylyltransferase
VRVLADLREMERGRPAIVTVGAFDGVHRGHQYLIRQVIDRARSLDFESVILTFDPRPQVILRPGSGQLTGPEEKVRIIGALAPSALIVLPFTRELSQMTAGQFLVAILERINVSELWVGADFAFGHNREGNVPYLIQAGQQSGFSVHVVARKSLVDVQISSTIVRELIERGDMVRSAELLGHFLRLSGTVVDGHGRGMEMGFPTANVQLPPWQQLPALGIYAGYFLVGDRRMQAAVSVGTNPTFGDSDVVVEAYVLDFDGDLRNANVAIDLVARIRDEAKFDTVDALLERMRVDVHETRQLLSVASEPGELLLQ